MIDNARGAAELTDYQVRVKLTAPVFGFSMAVEDGADLRFTDSDRKTALDYWIESFDRAGQSAVVWVNIPHILTGATKTVHVGHRLIKGPLQIRKQIRLYPSPDSCYGAHILAFLKPRLSVQP